MNPKTGRWLKGDLDTLMYDLSTLCSALDWKAER
jgi:hypothetical protein